MQTALDCTCHPRGESSLCSEALLLFVLTNFRGLATRVFENGQEEKLKDRPLTLRVRPSLFLAEVTPVASFSSSENRVSFFTRIADFVP